VADAGCARCRRAAPAPDGLVPTISSQSRHSARTLPTQRSVKALALGAWTGASTTSAPSARKRSSKARRTWHPDPAGHTEHVAPARRVPAAGCGLLGNPGTVRVGSDPGQVDASGVQFDENNTYRLGKNEPARSFGMRNSRCSAVAARSRGRNPSSVDAQPSRFRAAGAQQLCSTKPREPPHSSPPALV
jgi:hypothetical protein